MINKLSHSAQVAELLAEDLRSKAHLPPDPVSIEQSKRLVEEQLKPFDPKARARIIQGVKKLLEPEMKAELAEAIAKKAKTEAFQICHDWLGVIIDKGPTLEPNQASRLYKLFEAGISANLLDLNAQMPKDGSRLKGFNHAFVVKHDWAAALANAKDVDDGEIKLPYELCAFEFRISGRSVTALAWDTERAVDLLGQQMGFTVVIECGGLWFDYGGSSKRSDDLLIPFIWKHIRAICIALDAEVAVHEVVRAPVALNAKRARNGKPPILDHHIIDLARRHRISNPVSAGTGTKKRLHFRRGHWRHYEEHKTWIKWQLVGDPDLGFIQNKYSL